MKKVISFVFVSSLFVSLAVMVFAYDPERPLADQGSNQVYHLLDDTFLISDIMPLAASTQVSYQYYSSDLGSYLPVPTLSNMDDSVLQAAFNTISFYYGDAILTNASAISSLASNYGSLATQTGFLYYLTSLTQPSNPSVVRDASLAATIGGITQNQANLFQYLNDTSLLSKQNGFVVVRRNSTEQFSNQSLKDVFFAIMYNQVYPFGYDFLTLDGVSVKSTVNYSVPSLLVQSTLGLASILRGTDHQFNSMYTGSLWSFGDDEDDSTLVSTAYSVSGGFPMINTLLDNLNAGIYQLVNVQANPGEQEIANAAKQDRDDFHENFQGDGSGSSKGSIKDMAGVSSGFQDTFDTGANPGQFFTQVNDNAGGWFSQDVKDALSYSGPAAMDLDVEEELTHFYEDSREEFFALLGGG